MITRALAGVLLAGAIALAARKTRSLSTTGAFAALVVGTAATIAGWGFAIVVITFFIVSSALSRIRRAAREARIAGIVEKGDERDALQVLANGGVFAVAAITYALTSNPAFAIAALGALAGAAADTWATEIGTLAGGVPRSIVSLSELPPGTSGGVTLVGTAASVVGAFLVALVSYLTGVAFSPVAVFVGGIAGSIGDSLIGATVQERRWCDTCDKATERRVHICGSATRVVGGVSGLRNDFVNVLCTVIGAVVAVAVAR